MILPSAAAPPPRIDAYELASGGPGYRWFAVCFPAGRHITAFGDSRKQVEQQIKDNL